MTTNRDIFFNETLEAEGVLNGQVCFGLAPLLAQLKSNGFDMTDRRRFDKALNLMFPAHSNLCFHYKFFGRRDVALCFLGNGRRVNIRFYHREGIVLWTYAIFNAAGEVLISKHETQEVTAEFTHECKGLAYIRICDDRNKR